MLTDINIIKQNGTTKVKSIEFFASLPSDDKLLNSSSDLA
jgi:hypothetical protein